MKPIRRLDLWTAPLGRHRRAARVRPGRGPSHNPSAPAAALPAGAQQALMGLAAWQAARTGP